MNGLKKIKMMPAREQAAAVLREAILTKKLPEGEILTLNGIAKQLGVSSTPVREAFQILARDGLIQLHPNKGATVEGISQKFIQDYYGTRAILESESAAACCRDGADNEAIITAYHQGQLAVKNGNYQEYQQCNQNFHFAIWSAADNDRIRSILSSMWVGTSAGSNVTQEGFAKISLGEHSDIYEAIVNQDGEKAKESMRHHIIRSMNSIMTRFK